MGNFIEFKRKQESSQAVNLSSFKTREIETRKRENHVNCSGGPQRDAWQKEMQALE